MLVGCGESDCPVSLATWTADSVNDICKNKVQCDRGRDIGDMCAGKCARIHTCMCIHVHTHVRAHTHSVRVSWVEHWPSLRTRTFIVRDPEMRTKEWPAHVHWWRATTDQELGPQILQGHELQEEDIPPIPYLWCDLGNNLNSSGLNLFICRGNPSLQVVIRFSTVIFSQHCLPCLCGGT